MHSLRLRKILVPIAGLDLNLPLGGMNAIWQFLKGMYEAGLEIIAVPYLDKSRDSLWWRSYDNPCYWESIIYLKFSRWLSSITGKSTSRTGTRLVPRISRALIRPKWRKALIDILNHEKDVSAVLFWNIPLNHITGIPSFIRHNYGIPVVYYDGDLPFSLPSYGGFSFDYYQDADLSEYDAFIGNSETALQELRTLGAKSAYPVHFAADPDLFSPVPVEKQDVDVFFSAWGNRDREFWMNEMITTPSKKLNSKFVIAGGNFTMDLGTVKIVPFQPLPSLRYTISRSKINLSITRQSVTENMGSNSRPFELAAMAACMVSNPNQLIEKWFKVGEEIFIAHDHKEAVELYQWLLDDDDYRKRIGARARERLLSEHTFKHRAREIHDIIESCR